MTNQNQNQDQAPVTNITFLIDPELKRQFRLVAASHNMTMTDILTTQIQRIVDSNK